VENRKWKAESGKLKAEMGTKDGGRQKTESRKLKAEMGTEDGGRKTEDGGQRSEDSKAESRKLKAEMGAGQGSEFEMPKAAVVQVDFQGADAPSGQCSVAGSQ